MNLESDTLCLFLDHRYTQNKMIYKKYRMLKYRKTISLAYPLIKYKNYIKLDFYIYMRLNILSMKIRKKVNIIYSNKSSNFYFVKKWSIKNF